MEDVEKMAALKKVYADIILNMAKDSAARVLASERRAVGFQHGLEATKEEALATLLRLKSIMDSKIREAEMASMGQVRRIQELEDQLNEAEDIICSLRTELKRVNNEMDEMRNNATGPLNQQDTNDHITSSLDESHKSQPSSDHAQCSPDRSDGQRTAEGLPCSVENSTRNGSTKDFSAENECGTNTVLASIIMNRCTQRIRAFEQNLPAEKAPLGRSDDQIVCENTKATNTVNLAATDVGLQMKSSTEAGGIVHNGSSCGNGLMKRLKIPTRRSYMTGGGLPVENSTLSEGILQNGIIKHLKFPIRKCRGKRNVIKAPNRRISSDIDAAVKGSSETVSCKRPKDEKKIYPDTSIKNASSGLLRCSSKRTVTMESVMKRSHSDSENQNLPSSLNDTPVAEPVQNDGGNKPQMEAFRTDAEDTHNSNPETHGVSIDNCDGKGEKTFESKAGSSRFLKYTFQRKRKRGSLNTSNEDAILEAKNTSKRTRDEHDSLLEPQKPSLAVELPRKDRRLVQVARQLISLSERRW